MFWPYVPYWSALQTNGTQHRPPLTYQPASPFLYTCSSSFNASSSKKKNEYYPKISPYRMALEWQQMHFPHLTLCSILEPSPRPAPGYRTGLHSSLDATRQHNQISGAGPMMSGLCRRNRDYFQEASTSTILNSTQLRK